MIKNIVLDMGNVLLDYDPAVPLKKFLETEEDQKIIYRARNGLWAIWEISRWKRSLHPSAGGSLSVFTKA